MAAKARAPKVYQFQNVCTRIVMTGAPDGICDAISTTQGGHEWGDIGRHGAVELRGKAEPAGTVQF